MMHAIRKNIIQFALSQNIENINTYAGYKGDLIVKITTRDKDAVSAIRKFALDQDILEVVVKHNPHLLIFEVYCVTEDENVYHIKINDEFEAEHKHETSDDPWGKTVLD